MSYSVRIKRSAAKELADFPKRERTRIVHAIDSLSEKALAGRRLKGGMRGLRHLRVGDYRVVYELLDGELVVLVIPIAHHSDGYRQS